MESQKLQGDRERVTRADQALADITKAGESATKASKVAAVHTAVRDKKQKPHIEPGFAKQHITRIDPGNLVNFLRPTPMSKPSASRLNGNNGYKTTIRIRLTKHEAIV